MRCDRSYQDTPIHYRISHLGEVFETGDVGWFNVIVSWVFLPLILGTYMYTQHDAMRSSPKQGHLPY